MPPSPRGWGLPAPSANQGGLVAFPHMGHCLIAAGTHVTANAGAEAAKRGGNAIDAAVAAAAASWVCEPGMTALGSAALAMVRPAGGGPALVDGLTAMPGLGGHQGHPSGGTHVTMPYGPGVVTGVGPASVAVPGGPAALEEVHRRWGRLRWAEVLAPAIRLAAEGFPFPGVSAAYMPLSGEVIYDLTAGSHRIWRTGEGHPRSVGELTVLPELAMDLELLAESGTTELYHGALGARIADWLLEHGGAMSREDLAAYQVEVREVPSVEDHGWNVTAADTIGGEALRELVAAFSAVAPGSEEEPAELVTAMQAALRRRDERLHRASASTTQICAADQDGAVCSITTSTGYGSGVVVPGTGIMLNNMLGELELLPNGPAVLRPGDRLPSNMTPMVATRGKAAIAIGAAGADRIGPAIAQVWRGVASRGEPADVAIEAPRFHIRAAHADAVLDYEPGFEPRGVSLPLHPFDGLHMYFGGVQVAGLRSDGTLDGGGDPRRGGTTAVA